MPPAKRPEPDVDIVPAPPKETTSQTRARLMKRSERMREYFAQMPKEPVRIRKDDGEQRVQINGYTFRIQPADKPVMVPTQVADMLRVKGVI